MMNDTLSRALALSVVLLAGCAAEANDPDSTEPESMPAPVVESGDVHPTHLAKVGKTAGGSTGASGLGKAAGTHPCTVCRFG